MNEIERAIARLEFFKSVRGYWDNTADVAEIDTALSILRAELEREKNPPLIQRERWIVLRDGTEVFCGLARQYHFKPITELGNTALKTYLSKNKAIAAFEDSWRTKFDNCRYTIEKITETYVREPKGEKE